MSSEDHSPPGGAVQEYPHAIVGAASPPLYVYAFGQVQPRFPSVSCEKEFAQVAARSSSAGKTDRQVLHSVLSARENRYLARQLCWVLMVGGMETYLLTLRDTVDLELLIDAVRPVPEPSDLDVVVGLLGPLSRPEACGLILPIVAIDHIYSFDRTTLVNAIPSPDSSVTEEERKHFDATALELLDRILQLSDNTGTADEHRALNYLAVRYPDIYALTASAHVDNEWLDAVDVRPSRLGGARKVLDVIFSYRHRQHDVVQKHFVRVDVTEEFPFLVSKLAPYFDR